MSVVQTIIEFKYTNSIRQAREIEKIAAELAKLSNRDMTDAIQAINQNWTGENASTYLAKTTDTRNDISKTAISLQKTAASITKIAQNLYNAEMNALTIASERRYGS